MWIPPRVSPSLGQLSRGMSRLRGVPLMLENGAEGENNSCFSVCSQDAFGVCKGSGYCDKLSPEQGQRVMLQIEMKLRKI